MAFTTHGANELLDGSVLPATLYAQLHTGDPGDGTANVSLLVPGRVSFTRGPAVGGVAANDVEVAFVQAGAGVAETILAVSVWDAETGGNAWLVDPAGPVSIKSGDPVVLAVGELLLRIV